MHSKVSNYDYKQYPKFEDYGDATLVAEQRNYVLRRRIKRSMLNQQMRL
ncbi:hypothetical protein [Aquibacillus albus]|uniref:Uncharacterized protein n=1 Tax=Aquibacillus albus TaxID=1168171 RepID=A0ABS2N3Q4_9BACI|nr:hypothetical protein [Aquibacillus albus]MBM7572731.1 hypothetical protein [Aquibacillus albus]